MMVRVKPRSVLAALLLAAAVPALGAAASDGEWDGKPVNNARDFAPRLLAAHNKERLRLGLAPLAWSPKLAAAARDWAQQLARRHEMVHSDKSARPGQGENLFSGTTGAYTVEEMIDDFIDEREDFTPGVFPNVARDGNWHNVGHYTQLIWRKTTTVGCALASDGTEDFLVCRYGPAGNVVGQQVP